MNFKEANNTWRYDPETGKLFWIIKPHARVNIGDEAGNDKGRGYLQVQKHNKNYYVHRLIWLLIYKKWPKEIDHIDGNPSNNKLNNLRLVTRAENIRNIRVRSDNKSGVMGVCWINRSNKWRAQIFIKELKTIQLGYYKDWFEAVCARKAAEFKYNFHPNHGRK